jgi:DNA-directed RNA polymerase specialized sigma24 family protein
MSETLDVMKCVREIKQDINVNENVKLLAQEFIELVNRVGVKARGNYQEVKDLMNDTALMCWQTAVKYNGNGDFAGWVYYEARQRHRTSTIERVGWDVFRLRTGAKEKAKPREFVGLDDVMNISLETAESSLDLEVLRFAIDELSEEGRAYLKEVLRYDSFQEASRVLHCRPGTIKWRMKDKIMPTLKTKIDKELHRPAFVPRKSLSVDAEDCTVSDAMLDRAIEASKLNAKKGKIIKEFYRQKGNRKAAARALGVSFSNVQYIIKRYLRRFTPHLRYELCKASHPRHSARTLIEPIH